MSSMEYRQLGRSGLRVSVLTLGTMTFGGQGIFQDVGSTDLDGARRLIDMCIDAGVNMLDTADAYSSGVSEEMIGAALEGSRRDKLLVTTKARFAMGDGPNDAGLSRHHVIAACEASLRRLRADHIDLYLMHEWDGQTPVEETLDALDTLVRSGKVRYIGCSNYTAWQLMKALGVSERLNLQRFVSHQIYYSLQAREAEYELVPLSVDQGIGLMIWSPLAGGLLSGKYRRGAEPPSGSRHLTAWDQPPVRDSEALYDIVDAVVEIAEGRGVPPTHVALAWLLRKPAVSSLVIGARTEEQLESNLGAAALRLSDDEQSRLDEVSAPPLLYPYWHQAATAPERLGAAELTLLRPYVES